MTYNNPRYRYNPKDKNAKNEPSLPEDTYATTDGDKVIRLATADLDKADKDTGFRKVG